MSDIVTERLQHALGSMLTENTILSALSTISPHLTPHGKSHIVCSYPLHYDTDTTVLYDGCGSLNYIAQYNPELLTNMTSIDYETANDIYTFLNSN